MARKPKILPLLRYENPDRAIDWLVRAFGFEEHYVHRDHGRLIHAELRLGDDLIFVGPVSPDDKYGMKSPRNCTAQCQCICVALEDVDAHCEQAGIEGAEVVTPPHNTPYGARAYTCLDPEGHIWTFGTYWGEPLTPRSRPQ